MLVYREKRPKLILDKFGLVPYNHELLKEITSIGREARSTARSVIFVVWLFLSIYTCKHNPFHLPARKFESIWTSPSPLSALRGEITVNATRYLALAPT